MNILNILYMLPLAADATGAPKVFQNIFITLRSQAISSSQAFVSLAMSIAALIIVFKMIKLSYDLQSDDQGSGFDSVHLWTVLRPVVILMLIQTCSFWIGGLDNLVSGVTGSIQTSVTTMSSKKDMRDLFKKAYLTNHPEKMTEEEMIAIIKQQRQKDSAEVSLAFTQSFFNGLFALAQVKTRSANRIADEAITRGNTQDRRALVKAAKGYIKAYDSYAKKDGSSTSEEFDTDWDLFDKDAIPAICIWLYDRFYLIIQLMADILLFVVLMFAPFSMALSLLEPFKQGTIQFITTYLQISFWKVIAAIINLGVSTGRQTIAGLAKGGSGVFETAVLNDAVGYSDGGILNSSVILCALVSVAGIMLLLKVSDITAALIPSSNFASAAGGGSTMVNIGAKGTKMAVGATVGTVKTGAKVFTGGKGK